MHDAYFGIGLYRYYADVAPAVLKALRWLLLLPGGEIASVVWKKSCAPVQLMLGRARTSRRSRRVTIRNF